MWENGENSDYIYLKIIKICLFQAVSNHRNKRPKTNNQPIPENTKQHNTDQIEEQNTDQIGNNNNTIQIQEQNTNGNSLEPLFNNEVAQPELDHSVPHVHTFFSDALMYYTTKADKSTQTCFKSDGSASQVLNCFAQVKAFKTECD